MKTKVLITYASTHGSTQEVAEVVTLVNELFSRSWIQKSASGETGIAKPDRRAFEMILARLGSSAERAIMIGDRLATDIQGAQKAGMRAVWVNRSRKDRDSPVIPDWEIASLEELGPILAQLDN